MIERLFPDKYFKKVEDIDINELKKANIKGLIIDIDNTLIDYNRVMRPSTAKWVKEAKTSGLKVYLLSNNVKEKVSEIADKLEIKGIHGATKPRRRGFITIMKEMNVKNTEIAVIGDQIFTDVYGGNRLNMMTILVEQIGIKDIFITKIKRPLEKCVLNHYNRQDKNLIDKKNSWKLKSAACKLQKQY